MEDIESKRNRDPDSKHKHKKKKHHHKKKKTSKKRSSSSEESEMEWVEAPSTKLEDKPAVKTTQIRDDWMNEEMFVATLSKDDMRCGSSKQKKIEAQALKREKEEAIQNERELNPHWKNNGTGLPEKQSSAGSLALPATSVGDGGYGYLKKAYYRIKEQSQQEGRSMEEIAVERWGSLDKLLSLINEAEDRMKHNSRTKYSSEKYKFREKQKIRSSSTYHKPSNNDNSPSPSPERSFKYQKPNESRKRDRRIGHFSSGYDRKRNRENENEFRKNNKYDFSDSEEEQRKHSSDSQKQNIPAWKKIRQPSNKDELINKPEEENIFVWEKTSSKHKGDNLSDKRESNKQPNWKKPQKTEEIESTFAVHKSPEYASSDEEAAVHQPESSIKNDSLPDITSEDDLNKLAARCTKAELMGDTSLVAKLKKQLEEAREVLKSGGYIQSSERNKEKVQLTKMDSSGQERPIRYSDDIRESQTKQRKKQSQKFFDDGSRYSLKQMFEREKLTTTDDNVEMFMEVAAQCKDADDENETSGISKKATNKMANHLQEEKDIGRAIQQHHKRKTALEKCNYCLDQPGMKRHLIIQKFSQIYLCIPDFQSLVEGHCLIVPKRHVQSFLTLDEGEWSEVEDLKLNLRNMFLQQNKNIIVLETSRNFRYFPHAFLEVIPVPEDISDMAPIYFKKAILESETEWANNVKLIDLSKKNLRHSVPKNLPYFYVQFDPKIHLGYAHVIEDEKNFERNFGKEVIGGMLDIDYNYLFKNRKEDPSKKSKETVNFVKMWKTFNNENEPS